MRSHRLREDDLRKNFSPLFIVYLTRVSREFCSITRNGKTLIANYNTTVKRAGWKEKVTQDCVVVSKKKKKKNIIEFREGLPRPEDNSSDPLSTKLVDDLMRESSLSEVIVDLFTKGIHHKNLSVILIS